MSCTDACLFSMYLYSLNPRTFFVAHSRNNVFNYSYPMRGMTRSGQRGAAADVYSHHGHLHFVLQWEAFEDNSL